jgi:N-methylhydantoinase A
MSGPAAGVIAQIGIAGEAGITTLVGMDVGGTSTDISVIVDGLPQMRSEFDIEFGTVVGFPMIDINSIAAGGGTIAWLDEGGMLHSGPRSAGANPGPACYMRGGTEPTVTDAHVVAGRLNDATLLGGSMAIDARRSHDVVAQLGAKVGLAPDAMAAGIIALTVSNIGAAIRSMTVEKGLNPGDLALVAYGGGGPTIACDVADDLRIPRVLVPRHPGLTSASGLLLTDIRHDFVRTFLQRNDECAADAVTTAFDILAQLGDAKLAHENIPESERRFELAADLRYIGQTHELTIALGGSYDVDTHARLSDLLKLEHLKQFGHAPEGVVPVEIVNLRLAARGLVSRPDFGGTPPGSMPMPVGQRPLLEAGERRSASLYMRDDLRAGNVLAGPAIIEQLDTTTVILMGWRGTVLETGSILLDREDN